MSFDPLLADLRFGYSRAPSIPAPLDAQTMLDGLTAPDTMAQRFPVPAFDSLLPRMQARAALARERRSQRGTARAEALREEIAAMNNALRDEETLWLAQHVLRRVWTPTPFLERLEAFWADHFTALGKAGLLRYAGAPYIASAIRPHLAGRFEDLLFEAVTHPLMVHFLDQDKSIGPGSQAAADSGKGLNENLAREILELHTLGVDGPYTQQDVRQLAELLTGLTYNARVGRAFYGKRQEPGRETVLGQTYRGGMEDIRAALRDLARHPATARHLSWKLAVHFISDTPPEALVKAMTRAYLDSDGMLAEVYRALLAAPEAWSGPGTVKPPFGFICAALRSLAVPPEALTQGKKIRRLIWRPLTLMGQPWLRPTGPDGFDEADAGWITPQGMAARLQWALSVPERLVGLPDPRDFVETALGARASAALRFAAEAAESRADGVGLILASPEFQKGA